MTKALLAIAIEDRVDLWFERGSENVKLPSNDIPEGGNYFERFHRLIEEQFIELIRSSPNQDAGDLFNSIAATVVSVRGVVRDNKTLLQISLWYHECHTTARWNHNGVDKAFFDFPEELTAIAASLVSTYSDKPWRAAERQRFKETVFVVNDATAAAAFEYGRQFPNPVDFIYLKLHNGVNCGVVERGQNGKFTIRSVHAEMGHLLPLTHKRDDDADFFGVCTAHKRHGCFEGMLSCNSFYHRAINSKDPNFASWKRHIDKLEAQGYVPGRELDKALIAHILGSKGKAPKGKGGVELVADYAAQIVHQLAVGYFAPTQIIVGGRLAKPLVLDAIRAQVVWDVNGYPNRQELTAGGINGFIVPSRAKPEEKRTIEVGGALTIARSRAHWTLGTVLQLVPPSRPLE